MEVARRVRSCRAQGPGKSKLSVEHTHMPPPSQRQRKTRGVCNAFLPPFTLSFTCFFCRGPSQDLVVALVTLNGCNAQHVCTTASGRLRVRFGCDVLRESIRYEPDAYEIQLTLQPLIFETFSIIDTTTVCTPLDCSLPRLLASFVNIILYRHSSCSSTQTCSKWPAVAAAAV